MPAERVSMRKIREVLRLTHALGMSRRLVGEATGIGKTAVGEYVRRAAMAGLRWPIPDTIDDADLERRLFPPREAGSSAARTDPDWSHIHAEMKRRGVTLALLWQEYRGEHAEGYAYSWFCERYSDWRKRITPTMRQTHLAGEKLFVDWAGDAIAVFDPITGAEHGARIFVAALGASNYTYAEARWTETLPDWIGAHVNALSAIGGVPKAVVCDNLKAGITKPSRYEPGINRSYQDLADHYGFVVLPTRVRKPRDKAKVEVAVLIVERFVLAKLRNRRFFSLDELNAEVRECVATINANVMNKLAKSRRELLETIDRPALKELPSEPYRYAEWKRCGVAPDYHVEVDHHYYSVPFRLLRETVEARLTESTFYRSTHGMSSNRPTRPGSRLCGTAHQNQFNAFSHGLKFYFTCSYLNDPYVGKTFYSLSSTANADRKRQYLFNLDEFKTADKGQTEPHELGEVWGGAFWELRKKFGREKTDRLLLETWKRLQPAEKKFGEG